MTAAESKKRKVLIVSYVFPPMSTAGAVRVGKLAKYLPEFGWQAVILTAALPGRPDPQFEVLETPRRESVVMGVGKRLFRLDPEQTLMAQIAQVKKKLRIRSERSPVDLLLAAVGEVTAYPDPEKGWRPYALGAGHDLLCQGNIQAIISSSPPVTGHIIARELKERWSVPWLADFRDLWTQNYYYPYSPLRRSIERKLELKTLAPADGLVTASPPAAGDLGALHSQKQIHSIPNGFDPAELNSNLGVLTDRFTITYTGTMYTGRQSPEPLFAALSDLIAERTMQAGDVEVRFYGPEAGWIDKQARAYGLAEVVKQFGMLPRETVLEKQRESQVLLSVKWKDARHRGFYTAKVFEYLAARRPIVAVGGFPDVVDDLLEETGAGVSGQTWLDVKPLLLQMYQEYKSTGAVTYAGDEARISRYSHREMARRFATILDSLSE